MIKKSFKLQIIAISFVISSIILFFGIWYNQFSFEEYYDVIYREVSMTGYNKSGELKVVWIAIFCAMIITFVLAVLSKKEVVLDERKISLDDLFFSPVLIAVVIFYIVRGNWLVNYILCIAIGVFFRNDREKREKEKIFILLIIFHFVNIAIYAFLNLFLNYPLVEMNRFTKILFILQVLFISFVVKKENKENIINRIILLVQAVLPFLLSVFLVDRYTYNGDEITIAQPINFKFIIISIMSILLLKSLLNIRKYINNSKDICNNDLICSSTIISILVFKVFKNSSYIYSMDLWHTGEELLPYHQIVEKGLQAYTEYNSEAGLFPMLFGFFNEEVLGGKAVTYNFAWALQFIFFGILIGVLITLNIKKVYALFIILFFTVPDYNRVLLIIPTLLILSNEDLISYSFRWLISWIFLCWINGLYYPVYGVAILLGTFPFFLIQCNRFIKDRKKHLNRFDIILVILVGFLIVINLPMLFRMMKHILSMSNQSILADGLGTFQLLKVPENFLPWISQKIMRQLCYCVFTFSIPCIIASIFIYMMYLLIKNKGRSAFQSPCFLLLSSGCITLPVTYLFGFVRMDDNWFLARAGVVIILFSSFILPIILLKYGISFIDRNSIFLIMGICMGITGLIQYSNFGDEVDTILHTYSVPEGYQYITKEEYPLEKLGEGFGKVSELKIIDSLNEIRQLFHTDKILYMGGVQALYYIYDEATPIPDAAIVAVADKKNQLSNLEIVKDNPPDVICWAGLAAHEYYIYRWIIDSGYVPYTCKDYNYFVKAEVYAAVFDDCAERLYDMQHNYSIYYFADPNLQYAATSWGNSIESLADNLEIIREYKKNDYILELNGNMVKNDIYINQNDQIEINLNYMLNEMEADFMYIDFGKGKFDISIYWEIDNEYKETHYFRCSVENGKILVPMGIHPGWFYNRNNKIKIVVNSVLDREKIEIEELKFYKLKMIE